MVRGQINWNLSSSCLSFQDAELKGINYYTKFVFIARAIVSVLNVPPWLNKSSMTVQAVVRIIMSA